jgi:hypothetical protein
MRVFRSNQDAYKYSERMSVVSDPVRRYLFSDGFMGGDLVEGNVIFNMVRETGTCPKFWTNFPWWIYRVRDIVTGSGDHGTFNSWDRREWFFDCALSGSSLSGNCLMPKMIRTQHNMFIGPAGWNMDHDDGSTNFHDFSNLVCECDTARF